MNESRAQIVSITRQIKDNQLCLLARDGWCPRDDSIPEVRKAENNDQIERICASRRLKTYPRSFGIRVVCDFGIGIGLGTSCGEYTAAVRPLLPSPQPSDSPSKRPA